MDDLQFGSDLVLLGLIGTTTYIARNRAYNSPVKTQEDQPKPK